jgi:hypothetical protein
MGYLGKRSKSLLKYSTDPVSGAPPHFIKEIAIVGAISETSNTAEESLFRQVFEKKLASSIRCISDNNRFARRRLVNPKTVYSGLMDTMRFEEVLTLNIPSVEAAIEGCDGFLAFNVSMLNLYDHITMAVRLQVKRVILAVNVAGRETGNNLTDSTVAALFSEAAAACQSATIPLYTVIKYGEYEALEEFLRPFRIVPSVSSDAIPKLAAHKLASGDLLRVLAECIDLPKTYNRVFGIGPGNALDNEILVWMKAQRVVVSDRVAVLFSDFQETSERRLKEMNDAYLANSKANSIVK